ncbi:unnamed protein product [Microthlaspi erraticum]|uniref:Uncharacterized protein n=1 Tax=Microthlaspi erraticum TaxID=1685480 RepID=A0A6D2JV35_9BRAS|nr:unnamed protein product [Microthlaspi erraticum]
MVISVTSPEQLTRAKPSSALKGKFKALRELSHRIWPEVVEALERKKKERKEKKERKSKHVISATPLSVKPPRSKKKPRGLKKRTPVSVDDVIVASKPALKNRRSESPKLRDSPSPPLQSSSIASQTKISSRARHAKEGSSSTAERTPENVIDIDSPPAADQEGDVSRQDEDASRQDDDLGSPPRGGASPTQTREEFLTPHDDAPSFDRDGPEEGGSSRRPREGFFDDDEGMSRHSEMGGSVTELNLMLRKILRNQRSSLGAVILMRWRRGNVPLMENQDACGGSIWVSKVHPGWGIPREGLAFRGDFDEASQHHVKSGGKFAALIQKYETAIRVAKDEVSRMQREQEKAKDVDAMVADLKLKKLVLESKVTALNEEIVKTLGLQDTVDQLRAQVADLGEKAHQDAEAATAEAERLRRSRQEWAEIAATQVYNSVNVGDAVEAAVGRKQVDEALLSFVKKIQGVDLDFDAVEEKLEAKLTESFAEGDSIDEVVVGEDDFMKPHSLSMSEVMLPKSPSRQDDTGTSTFGANPI